MDRRMFLGGALALGGCAGVPAPLARTGFYPDISEGCDLPPVRVAADRLIRTVVGLRPWRAAGFVVRAEPFADKRLVHNYGHGGAGITLCWGTARLAADLALPGSDGPVAVLGAGAVGLTTARLLQEAGRAVTIYTAALPPETTSNIAGGQWYPSLAHARGQVTPAYAAQLRAAALYAYRRYQLLAGPRYGVRWMQNYDCSASAPGSSGGEELLAGMLPQRRALSRVEHPFPYPFVTQTTGMLIEPSIFLRETLIDFHTAGGRIVVRRLADRGEVAALAERVVVNCTGLGARELFGDTAMTAMRGQLSVLLPQPEVRYAVSAPGGLYMFSRADGVVLGGSADRDDFSLEPDRALEARVLAGHRRLFGAMARCAG